MTQKWLFEIQNNVFNFNIKVKHINIFIACISVHDLKVNITWQGYPAPTFTVHRKENLNL